MLPSSTMPWMMCKSSWAINGASPSSGSSSNSIFGLSISARPMASIWRSPPESWLPMLPQRSRRRENTPYTRSRVHAPGRATTVRFSSTVSDSNTSRCCGTQPRPRRARWWLGILVMSTPLNVMRPRRRRVAPISVVSRVVLPMPLRPSSARLPPAGMLKLWSSSTMASP